MAPVATRIALTGGIASGKSAVADLLARHGAVIIDSDVLAREVVALGTPGLDAIAERFGPGVLAADGSLDRAALGRIVFADPEARTALEGPNKTLAAQLANELREFFPDNAVEYFVSYYDYYQPEAYMAASDTYIEKDSSINDEIDRLRHSATARCSPGATSSSWPRSRASTAWATEEYPGMLELQGRRGDDMRATRSCARWSTCSTSATTSPHRGKFRVRGDVIEIFPAYEETRCASSSSATRSSDLDDRPAHRRGARELARCTIFPPRTTWPPRADASAPSPHRGRAAGAAGRARGRASCSRPSACACAPVRPRDDEQMGFCNGIENYSRTSTAARRASRRHAARLLPRGLPARHRREPRRCRSSRHVRGRPLAARRRWSSTASGCRARSTTGR
jgi:hypothetical protein